MGRKIAFCGFWFVLLDLVAVAIYIFIDLFYKTQWQDIALSVFILLLFSGVFIVLFKSVKDIQNFKKGID